MIETFPLQVSIPGAFLYGAVVVSVVTAVGLMGYAVAKGSDESQQKVLSQVGQYGVALVALLVLGHLIVQGHISSESFQTLFVGVLAAVGGYKIHERGHRGGREAERQRAKELARSLVDDENSTTGDG